MNLVQVLDDAGRRRVGLVEGDAVILLNGVKRVIDLARTALDGGQKLLDAAKARATGRRLPYGALLAEKRVLAPADHPDPAHCFITGTGLTHLGSAAARDRMHQKLEAKPDELTDSLRMFKLGIEGGKPRRGVAGVQPEWFYKGDGSMLRGPGAVLDRPAFALDGGEEPEIAGIYLVGPDGRPLRLGFALGNEFSDHVMERQNYLYLAHSKLRACALGPELRPGRLPAHIEGTSRIRRKGNIVWEKPFLTGEANMSHSLENLEFHHFKYELFRRPGDLHIHFFGTGTLSIADGFATEDGDEFEIEAAPFGAALRNPMRARRPSYRPGRVKAL